MRSRRCLRAGRGAGGARVTQAQELRLRQSREHGELIARGVKAFGFNTTLAPVLDLALPESAEVMGTRAAAPTAEEVVEYAREFLAGLAAQGVAGCGKHFPGLGGGTLDSHLETPAIRAQQAVSYGAKIWFPIANCAMNCRW